MERNISIERLYFLGDFRNLKVSDSIEGIPYEVFSDAKLMDNFRLLQLIQVDLMFQRYRRDFPKYNTMGAEEAIGMLEEQRSQTWEEIREEMNGKFGENKEGEIE